jgi:hypothetical protein
LIIIWGYTPADTLPTLKKMGGKTKEAKQVFSSILFRRGINGIAINIEKIEEKTQIKLNLVIDEVIVFEKYLSPPTTGKCTFMLEKEIIPISKIEICVVVEKGMIHLPISAIGTGMGFHKSNDEFVPTNHLPLGIIIS